MQLKRTCKVCGENFLAIKVTQFFCRRKCFKRDYYQRKKGSIQQEEQHPAYPIKKCNFCGVVSHLTFDPILFPKLFNNWACDACGVPNQIIWENQNSRNSYEVISNIMLTFKGTSISMQETKYQIYRIPISDPMLGNSSVVVMTCDVMNILDLQKKDRKKITFS